MQDDTASDPASTRIPLPSWIANVLELRICKYVSEHEKWQSSIEKRAHIGKALTKSQNERYQAWLADSVQRLVFNKKRQSYVSEARQITKDCIGIHLHLSDQPESLCVSVGAGADDGKFRLVLLKQNSLVVPQTIPDVLDQPLPPQALVEAGRDNDHGEGSGGEGNHDEGENEISEHQVRELEDERFRAEEMHPIDDEQGCDLLILADSDEDGEALGLPKGVAKTKSFFLRPAWTRLEQLNLTDLPRHISGCSIAHHRTSNQWQGFYPKSTFTLSSTWGGSTKRKEEESILKVVRAILESYLHDFPKDKSWQRQLSKVKEAEMTMSF